MRKGQYVKYIGADDELMAGQDRIYRVIKKRGDSILIYKPMRYLGGEIHDIDCYMPVSDFVVCK